MKKLICMISLRNVNSRSLFWKDIITSIFPQLKQGYVLMLKDLSPTVAVLGVMGEISQGNVFGFPTLHSVDDP